MSRKLLATSLSALIMSAAVANAQDASGHQAAAPDLSEVGGGYSAQVQSADGTDHGTVSVQPTPSGVGVVTLDLTGLPEGVLGVHLHETGVCEGPEFESAGGHLSRDGEEHGVLSEGGPHIGDLPNLHVPAGGDVMVEHFVPDLDGDILDDDDGTAFVIHAQADDYAGQPAGHAGARLACGVLQAAQ